MVEGSHELGYHRYAVSSIDSLSKFRSQSRIIMSFKQTGVAFNRISSIECLSSSAARHTHEA
jgi:hypothetical protein